jgi:hypothetical protein
MSTDGRKNERASLHIFLPHNMLTIDTDDGRGTTNAVTQRELSTTNNNAEAKSESEKSTSNT